MWKRIISITVVTLLLVGLTVVPALALLSIGQTAPSFQLNDLSGHAHKLSDYRGKVVVIDFFGADCTYCFNSAKNDLVPLYNNYYKNNARVQFLGIETQGASAAYTNSRFVQPAGITWPVLVGGTSVATSYGLTVVPTMYVIDTAGKVALAMPYPINIQTLKSTIDRLAGQSTKSTQLSLIPSTTTPLVGQSVTFTATLKSGTTPLSGKSVTIYHFHNGVRYTDTTKPTNVYGQITLIQSFGSIGKRPYYATFAGGSSYAAATSSVVNVYVKAKTGITLIPSTTTPAVNQPVTFTATLKSGTTPLSGKSVTIYHFFNGLKYTDTIKTTNTAGQITLTQHFGSTGQRPYYATFAGDASYKSSTGWVTINVGSSS